MDFPVPVAPMILSDEKSRRVRNVIKGVEYDENLRDGYLWEVFLLRRTFEFHSPTLTI